MEWNATKIRSLAPNKLTANIAKSLLSEILPHRSFIQQNLIWAIVQPSFKKIFLSAVIVKDEKPAFYCNCKEIAKPCAHALALLFKFADDPSFFSVGHEPPPELAVWAKEQKDRDLARKNRIVKPISANPLDLVSPARLSRMEEGLVDLERFLKDVIRQGIFSLSERSDSFFEERASRLVDAQLPALAKQMRAVQLAIHSDDNWPVFVIHVFSTWFLLIRAFRKKSKLNNDVVFDLLADVGVTIKKEEVVATDNRIDGEWITIGREKSVEGKLTLIRTWFLEYYSANTAMTLDYFFDTPNPEVAFDVNDVIAASFAFYPSAVSDRAVLVKGQKNNSNREATSIHGAFESFEEMLKGYAETLSAVPWRRNFTARINGVIPVNHNDYAGLVDIDGRIMPLSSDVDILKMMAISSGHPLQIFGEWNGEQLKVFSIIGIERIISVNPDN